MRLSSVVILMFMLVTGLSMSAHAAGNPVHALALHGDPKYPADFTHFDYTNPDAPKGGEMRMAAAGTFDTLNPFTLKGIAAPGISGLVYQTLMASSGDEAFSQYGDIAETVEVADDRSTVTYNLRAQAKWSDGKPVTAEDVVFSFDTLMSKGHPMYRAYYNHVKSAKAESPTRVTFTFDMKNNRELPLIIGQLPVLPKHVWADKDFSKTTLALPIGSGAYKVKSIDTGRRIVFERVKDWWGADLPVNKGQNNFDTIVYDLYREDTVLVQAFFANAYDVRQENIAKAWETEYDQRPVKEGLVVRREIKHSLPVGMQAFVYNNRRAQFQDIRVRKALNYAFDFEWSNKQFAYGKYKRNSSYFENSDLAGHGLPSEEELKILEPFRDKIPAEAFTAEYKNPSTLDAGGLRANLTQAKKLLEEAGYKMNANGRLEKDGKPLEVEFLINTSSFERWINPFIANLKKLGVSGRIRLVDAAQYENRLNNFDFDIIVQTIAQSLSPGNEQRDFWGSDKADIPGSRNLAGIRNPVADQLVEQIIVAQTAEDLAAHVKALDRVLLWNYYVIPQWYIDYFRLAYWDKFGQPAITPKYGLGMPETWWYDQAKADKIAQKIKPAD